jgi:hypothetical protein
MAYSYCAVWPALVVAGSTRGHGKIRLSKDSNQFSSKHPSRNVPLKLSMEAFYVGLPGSIKTYWMLCFCAQVMNALRVNSGSLSVLIILGYLRHDAARSSRRVN